MKESKSQKEEPARGRWRWIRRGVLACLALAIVSQIALPLWLGAALKVFVPDEVLRFESYETAGYGRFKLSGLEVEAGGLFAQIDEVEMPSPYNWLYRYWTEDRSALSVRVGEARGRWSPPAGQSAEPQGDPVRSLPEALSQVNGILGQVEPFLARLRIDRLAYELEDNALLVSEFDWNEGQLSLMAHMENMPQDQLELLVRRSAESLGIELSFENRSLWLEADSVWIGEDSVRLNSQASFHGNALTATAVFNRESWLPQEAEWQAMNWELSSDKLPVQSPYSNYRFDLEGSWDGGTYVNRLQGEASMSESSQAEMPLPDVAVNSVVGGDFDRARFDAFSVSVPGIEAAMKDPITIDFASGAMEGRAVFDIDLDLAILEIEQLAGALTGTFELASSESVGPNGFFRLSGRDLNLYGVTLDAIAIDANLDWPLVDVEQVEAVFSESSQVSLAGLVDLESRTISRGRLTGSLESDVYQEYLPDNLALGKVDFEIAAEGPLNAVNHQGTLRAERFTAPAFKTLDGNVAWDGVQARIENLDLELASERGGLHLSGSATWEQSSVLGSVRSWELLVDAERFAALQAPFDFSFAPGQGEPAEPSLELTTVRLEQTAERGLSVSAALQGMRSGQMNLTLDQIEPIEWLNPWLLDTESIPDFTVGSLGADLAWSDGGALSGSLAYEVRGEVAETETRSEGQLRLDERGLIMDAVSVSDDGGPLFNLQGALPASLYPSRADRLLELDRDAPLQLDFRSTGSETLQALLSRVSGFDVASLEAEVKVEGSLSDPVGALNLKLETSEVEGEYARPPISLDASGSFAENAMELDRVVLGHAADRFEARARVELPFDLAKMIEQPRQPDWKQTRLALDFQESSLSPISHFMPRTLNTGGTLAGELSGSLSDGFDGRIVVEELSTRAIFPFGALRDIRTEIVFSDTLASLRSFSAQVGREPLALEGWLDFSDLENLTYELKARGKELPILRRVGLLLRADLDLSVQRKGGNDTAVKGKVELRDGLYLLDTTNLVGSGGAGGRSAASRPPYFSVEAPPFDEWKLDVSLVGNGFMRIQTPATKGVLSTEMKLGGTLREPFVTGETYYEDGQLLFPFATFEIEQGIVDIRIEDPYTPILSIFGATRRFGYDLEVEISGSAFDPLVRFTSSPPLNSEQILLMVMAGENPEGVFDYSATQRVSKLGSYLSKGIFSSGGDSGVGSRFSLSTGGDLSRQGKETMEMELRLNDEFQLVGEYDEYDAWNGGIRWRVLDPTDKRAAKDEKGEADE